MKRIHMASMQKTRCLRAAEMTSLASAASRANGFSQTTAFFASSIISALAR